MEVEILVKRTSGTKKSTTGKLYLNGKYFCNTLEDIVRGTGVKVDGKTAIPEGTYKVKLTKSARFKRLMPIVYTEKDETTLINDGKSFKGIRIHGGNKSEDTEGCILVAFKKITEDLIQGTAEKALTEELSKYSKITLKIENKNVSCKS